MSADLADLGSTRCRTESDVEQKIVLPLLTAAEWLGISLDNLFTKQYLPAVLIDKGRRKISYFPDYSIWIGGLPICIVEVKSPAEDVEEGFREGQLYAHEANKAYPSNINPVQFVVSLNNTTLIYGEWDSGEAKRVNVKDLKLSSTVSNDLRETIGFAALEESAKRTRQRFRPTQVFRPIDSIGGESSLNRRLPVNSFATDLAPLIEMFFVSNTAERVDAIIEKAYVSSTEITTYDAILETFLRDTISHLPDPSAQPIETHLTGEGRLTPEIRSFGKSMPATGHMQLLIGPVGAGKSLFCQRYHRHLEPPDIAKATYWSFINVNDAQEDLSDLENWVCKAFIDGIEIDATRFDLYNKENLRKLFAPDINRLSKIYQTTKENDPVTFEKMVEARLEEWASDSRKFATAICRFVSGDRRDKGEAVVVVFDNVDRRDRDQQLKIFQVAQWFKSLTRTFCLLSLRDETYEQYKNQPPLDAFINAIHFTITPPRFIDVIKKRLELCIEHLAEHAPARMTYTLPDGKHIVYPSSRIGEFLMTLYRDIFRSGRRISWLLEALSGRNVRQSLEMFSRILFSGHLDARRITGTILGTEQFDIRDSTIVNVLMKTDYLFFDDSHGFITNILYCDPEWRSHSNFLVNEIVDYLVTRRKATSDIGSRGYVRVRDILNALNRMGFSPEDAIKAINFVHKRNLIVADHLGRTIIEPDDFVRAHASGFVHCRLLADNIHYLAGIVPSTYLNDRKLAEVWGGYRR